MRIPESLASLADYGIIEEVVRPLMSGKEAQIYLVVSAGQQRVAKVYKEAQNRTFKHRAAYTEGRKVRNSRDQRAMGKNSRHGRAQAESAWKTTEVETIYRLRDAGVRVPTPYHFIDGVLIMEMVSDMDGHPAPRLGDLTLEPVEAQHIFQMLLAEVVRMLSSGVVHGDLSDFNVLLGTDGPVIIDFPQAVDASSNANARKLLVRDVDNLHRFAARFSPEHQALPYAQEMWQLYERGQLTPDTRLTGRHRASERRVDTAGVLSLIGDAARDERRRREQQGLGMRGVGDAPRRDRPAGAPGPQREAARGTGGERGHAQQRGERGHAQHGERPQAQQRGERGHAQHGERGHAQHGERPQREERGHAQHGERGHAQRGQSAQAEPRQSAQAEPRQSAHAQPRQSAHAQPRQSAHAQPRQSTHAQRGERRHTQGDDSRSGERKQGHEHDAARGASEGQQRNENRQRRWGR
jgi:RIO kinase 1